MLTADSYPDGRCQQSSVLKREERRTGGDQPNLRHYSRRLRRKVLQRVAKIAAVKLADAHEEALEHPPKAVRLDESRQPGLPISCPMQTQRSIKGASRQVECGM